MGKVVTIGEPMGMFVAQTEGELKDVRSFDQFIAGAEVNVSVGVSRLGHQIQYVSAVGADPFGSRIIDFLKREQVDVSQVVVDGAHPTGFQLKSKNTKEDPEVVYFRKGSAAYHMDEKRVADIDFSDVDIFHVTGILMALNDETFSLVKQLVEKAKGQGTVITFDPNLRPTLWQDHDTMVSRILEIAAEADYVLPGIGEAEILMGSRDLDEIADYFLRQGVTGVIIKNGPKGAFMKYRADHDVITLTHNGFSIKDPVDTVGAGDGFAVGIITGLLEGLTPEEMLTRANAIGAIQICHVSDNENLPTPAELKAFIVDNELKKGDL